MAEETKETKKIIPESKKKHKKKHKKKKVLLKVSVVFLLLVVKIKAGNYNLVDINDFTKEELLQEKTLISKIMLLEKSESTEESLEMLEKEMDQLVASLEAKDKVYIKILTYEFENEYVSFRIFFQGKWEIKI